ncbi:MAG: 50S ribosomal protein L10 [Gemmatimonadetes bacterium]|nr:MAG: 50S ribosomal protein L10 [Gemmatimonadota bacterium]
MKRSDKTIVVNQVAAKLQNAQAIYLADFTGLNVASISDLRNKFREEAAKHGIELEFQVIKNTLIRIAAAEAGIEGLEPYLEGPTAVAFSSDIAVPAKVLTDFSKEHDGLPQVKAGVVEGDLFTADQVKQLATLPPREVLLSQLLGSLQSPIQGLASVLQQTVSKFVRVVDAIAKEKETQS